MSRINSGIPNLSEHRLLLQRLIGAADETRQPHIVMLLSEIDEHLLRLNLLLRDRTHRSLREPGDFTSGLKIA